MSSNGLTDPCPTCNGSGRIPTKIPDDFNRRSTHPTIVSAFGYALVVPIVRVLDTLDRPMSVPQIHQQAGTGSLSGIRKECERLALHGLLLVDYVAGAPIYTINRDHLTYKAAKALVQADDTLWAQESLPS